MEYKKCLFVLVLSIFLAFSLLTFASAVQPNGAGVTSEAAQRAPDDLAENNAAYAGNITELTIRAFAITQTWQGYFGNVTGVIQLADSNDKVMYNWTLANPEGEVYASVNDSIIWANIQCLNFSSSGDYTAESGTGGSTNLFGTNLSQLETIFNIVGDDVDGVDETFTLFDHDIFYTANREFLANECRSTRIFSNTGDGVDQQFEEVLLYEPASASVVFASLLEEASVLGFDNEDHDFEMLVLEDGHGTDVATTPYYFFVELE